MYYVLILAVLCQVSRVFSDTNYRLNTPIKPKAYSIAITPYFDTNDTNAFTFDGEVDITFTTENVTRQIKMHSQDLIYDHANISVLNGESVIQLNDSNPLVFDTNYTFAFINLQTDLQIELEYSLKIVYRGIIRDDYTGFYRISYTEGGVTKWLGATQMEHVSARKVFPCFDEPGLKATFSLSIDRPHYYKPSLANTNLQETVELSNGYIREVFYPTPIMSTYLVAFVVSELSGVERVNGTKEFSIYTRPEALNQTDHALNFGTKVVDALGAYFGIDYYSTNAHLKLKHIALPDFQYIRQQQNTTEMTNAMENWGAATYRESSLLNYQDLTWYKYLVARNVAHETTHMWFGNLVTCHWWSDAWLNEGFASYFEFYFATLIDPDVVSANDLINLVHAAYRENSGMPISNENVNSPTEIKRHASSLLSYYKPGAVIRMMHHLIGGAAFKHGINNYLETNKFSLGTPEELYRALEIGVQKTSSMAMYPDTNITEVMSSWITQAGYPILHVDINYETDTVLLTQNRFYGNSSISNSSNETYSIPVTYTTGVNPDFSNTKPVMVMKNRTHQFSIPGIHQDRRWVIFNIQETGLYRVSYNNESWKAIVQVLNGPDREKIHHLNRAKIVNDLFALFHAGEVKSDQLQDVFEIMSAETNYFVWSVAISGIKQLDHRYIMFFRANVQRLITRGINNVGFAVRANDSLDTLRNRLQILKFACDSSHPICIVYFVTLFQELKEKGIEIEPSLKLVAYCTVLRHGKQADYDFLNQRMLTTNIAYEAKVIGDALACRNQKLT